MKPAKFLILSLVVFSFYLTFANFSLAKEFNAADRTSFFQNLNLRTQNFFENIFQIFKQDKFTINSDLKTQDDGEAVKSYYKNFIEALNRANFTPEEKALMFKTKDSRILLLEELIEKVGQGENSQELKTSFRLWHQLDERVLSELNKLSAGGKTFSFHQTVVNWFNYHSKISGQFSEENLSENQISDLASQFRKNAKIHMLKLKQSLEVSKGFGKIFASFIPKTQAFTCTAFALPNFYHFGGRVTFIVPCDLGLVITVSLPCGGLLFFSYPMLAVNPYLYKTPIFGVAVLGKAIVIPGACPLGIVPIPFEAIVLYFGSSSL